MLVISRKVGERLCIQVPGMPDVWITVVGRKSEKIRIGIEAPKDYLVRREELIPESDRPRRKEAV